MLSRITAVLASTLLCLLVLVVPAQATFPGQNGKIAFHTVRTGDHEVFAMNADGSSQTDLSTNPATDSWAHWSPDGSKLAFASDRNGKFDIYVMNADGSGQTNLTTDLSGSNEIMPAWSPDGAKIAFVGDQSGTENIYVMHADGSARTRLTTTTGNQDSTPDWSPDGTKIAFSTNRDGNGEIYVMNADGSGQTDITNAPSSGVDASPSWSPDGNRIAFMSNRDGNLDIFVMNADGTGQSNITNNAASDEEPTWSPDGTKIAFGTDRDGNQEVYVVNPDGSNPTDLSNAANADFRPNWQPLVHNYARPRGATPMRISLVPAYKQCTAPNTVHSGSISSPSCEPPQPESSYLTVGTPDFNAQGPNSIGSVLFRVLPGPPEDDAISVSLTDVRCAGTSAGCSSGALSDYTDDLGFDATFRITDKGSNAGGVNRSATVTDLPLRFSVPCTATASTSVGSSCALNTTIRTVLGSSAIVAGQRSIWQLNGNVSLYDGGADGLSATRGDNTLFVVGGLFNP